MVETISRVIEVVSDELRALRVFDVIPEIHAETLLADDLRCDSLETVCIVCGLEEEFGLEISDDDAARWTYVGDIVASIDERLANV